MRNPMLYTIDDIVKTATSVQTDITTFDERNVPVQCEWAAARPIGQSGPFWHRWKLAWLVLTGKCAVVKWYKQ